MHMLRTITAMQIAWAHQTVDIFLGFLSSKLGRHSIFIGEQHAC